uniref:Uncharacterized protein n=1 Tax=uncultured marine microorganism HF4000_APKG7H23 TaxID=455551 RepID=B3T9V5_9ZZZZ|nr:hypothetical protein ALOHA_HF4000APKG7H23ctg3g29 [uncultured marine microorganism HF4000_APKG7H23]
MENSHLGVGSFGPDNVFDALQGLGLGARALKGVHLPIPQREDGLDAKQGTQQGLGLANAPALLEILQGVQQEVELDLGGRIPSGGGGILQGSASLGEPGRRHHAQALTQRGAQRVHQLNTNPGDLFGCLSGRVEGAAEQPGCMNRQDVVALGSQPRIHLPKSTHAGLGRLGQGPLRGQPGEELLRRDVDTIAEALQPKANDEGDHGDIQRRDQVGGQVGKTIGDNSDAHVIPLFDGDQVVVVRLTPCHQLHLHTRPTLAHHLDGGGGRRLIRIAAPVQRD